MIYLLYVNSSNVNDYVVDWNATTLGVSPMEIDKSSMVLPYVLFEFTPRAVSIIGRYNFFDVVNGAYQTVSRLMI